MPGLASRWMSCFYDTLQGDRAGSDQLREASLRSDLAGWTRSLTSVVVRTFEAMGMPTSAKGHSCTVLPIKGQEYLGQDVMAFPSDGEGWRFPVAACELENSLSDERVAYSLWKVLCVRCQIRIVFCYRPEPEKARPLVVWLGTNVVKGMTVAERSSLLGNTVIVVGSRNEADTFPYGFFQAWKLNTNTGLFERLARE